MLSLGSLLSVKLPKNLAAGEPLDPAPPEQGVEVHITLQPLEGETRRLVGLFAAPPMLDEVLELAGEERTYRVAEVRRSLRGLAEIKPDASGSLDTAYERLAKRGVPLADELVFVYAEEEAELTDEPEPDAG